MCWCFDKLSDTAKGFIMGTESRADLLARFYVAAKEMGIDFDKMTDLAVFSQGADHSKNSGGGNAEDFIKFMTHPGPPADAYGMEVVELSSEHSIAHFHNCPLVEKWKKMGMSTEDLDILCNIANKADMGRASNFNVELTFPKRRGAGDDYCILDAKTK